MLPKFLCSPAQQRWGKSRNKYRACTNHNIAFQIFTTCSIHVSGTTRDPFDDLPLQSSSTNMGQEESGRVERGSCTYHNITFQMFTTCRQCNGIGNLCKNLMKSRGRYWAKIGMLDMSLPLPPLTSTCPS